jgi:hypothetical protein
MELYKELSLGAQTAYAELQDQLQTQNIGELSALPGSFQRLIKRSNPYIYYNFRDIDGTQRMAYIGPEDERVSRLVERAKASKAESGAEIIQAQTKSAIALGCMTTLTKHFRVINRLGQYGFFRAGGILIGTHAFLAMGNMLGVKWTSSSKTMDVDFAHAGKNVSVALGANLKLSVHDALTSLEMGLLPIAEFSGKTGAQYRNPKDPELRLDFVTSETRDGKTVVLSDLGLALECLKFMEYSLIETTQAVLLSKGGSCIVNIPAPQRYAIHKLIIYGERPVAQRIKANKDLGQAASIIKVLLDAGNEETLKSAWKDALSRGPDWEKRAIQGCRAMLKIYPNLDIPGLW